MIDEYDNFANELWSKSREGDYTSLITGDGYIKTFFKNLKIYTGKDGGIIDRIFVTGVSPLVLDDLTSGANILTNISLDPDFNELPGFTEAEVRNMLDSVLKKKSPDGSENVIIYENSARNFSGSEAMDSSEKTHADKILHDMKKYYNGYIFSPDACKTIYNPSMTLYFLNKFQKSGEYPREMLDKNIQTDFNKLDYLLDINKQSSDTLSSILTILEKKQILCKIEDRFKLAELADINNLFSLMYYLGLLTISGTSAALSLLSVPNYVILRLYWDYIRKKIEKISGNRINNLEIIEATQPLRSGNIEPLVKYIYENIATLLSNRDLRHTNEMSFKFYVFSLLVLDQSYIIYSEPEMCRGYSDVLLKRDERYAEEIKYNWLIELKYLEKDATNEKITGKITEGKDQIEKYKKDKRWIKDMTINGARLKSVVVVFVNATKYQIVDCGEIADIAN